MRYHERMVMLSVIDGLWKDHLLSMDHLKEGIGLRGYAQQDPLVAYKRESFDMFEAMMLKFQEDTVRFLFRMQILGPDGQPVTCGGCGRAAPVPQGSAGGQRRAACGRRQRPRRARLRFPRAALDDHRCAGEGVPRKKQRELAAASRSGRRRCKPAHAAPDRRKGGTQRSLPLRQREEVQEVPRSSGVKAGNKGTRKRVSGSADRRERLQFPGPQERRTRAHSSVMNRQRDPKSNRRSFDCVLRIACAKLRSG